MHCRLSMRARRRCPQVVRAFDDDDVIHVAGKVSALDDVDVINLELALADLAVIEKRLERMGKGGREAKGLCGGTVPAWRTVRRHVRHQRHAAPVCLSRQEEQGRSRADRGRGVSAHPAKSSCGGAPQRCSACSVGARRKLWSAAQSLLVAGTRRGCRACTWPQAGKACRSVPLNKEEQLLIKSLGLITIKPMIYAANVPEDDLANKGAKNPHVKVRAS